MLPSSEYLEQPSSSSDQQRGFLPMEENNKPETNVLAFHDSVFHDDVLNYDFENYDDFQASVNLDQPLRSRGEKINTTPGHTARAPWHTAPSFQPMQLMQNSTIPF